MTVEMWTPWLCALPLESLLRYMTGSGIGQIRFDPKLVDPTSISWLRYFSCDERNLNDSKDFHDNKSNIASKTKLK